MTKKKLGFFFRGSGFLRELHDESKLSKKINKLIPLSCLLLSWSSLMKHDQKKVGFFGGGHVLSENFMAKAS